MTRLHVIALPHTQTIKAAPHIACAYTQKVVKFCGMMKQRGYEIVLYASEENDAECDELVNCISRAEQEELLGSFDWWKRGEIQHVSWDAEQPLWQLFNKHVKRAVKARLRERDIICFITGTPMRETIEAFPAHQRVEFGIGYEGVHPDTWHVFESYAWMHAIYGQQMGPTAANGRFFDAVIPNYFETADFPFSPRKGDYFLFMSRMIERKGYEIAIRACEQVGARLLVAGNVPEPRPRHACVQYVGLADAKRRGELLSHAQATFMPTLYLEPFGGVAVESLLCGTPVIATDWGAFPELIAQGVDGYRCHTMREFVGAMSAVRELDYNLICRRAQTRFGTETVGLQYEEYFQRLETLWEDGFYQLAHAA